MKKYRSKPVEIEAVQWDGNNHEELLNFCGPKIQFSKNPYAAEDIVNILTEEGESRQYEDIKPGHWIIRGTEGEFYPCKGSVFQTKYEPV